MGVLHGRLQERGENWRMCYKALLVLEYLCKQGPLVGHTRKRAARYDLFLDV